MQAADEAVVASDESVTTSSRSQAKPEECDGGVTVALDTLSMTRDLGGPFFADLLALSCCRSHSPNSDHAICLCRSP